MTTPRPAPSFVMVQVSPDPPCWEVQIAVPDRAPLWTFLRGTTRREALQKAVRFVTEELRAPILPAWRDCYLRARLDMEKALALEPAEPYTESP